MTAIVTRGDAGNLHLPDATVDLIVTSPPYFGLRSYQDGGEHYAEQIGAEATPAEYLDALMACTAEWMRVLKPGGSIFVNLGDKYSGSGSTSNNNGTGSSTLGHHKGGGGPHSEKLSRIKAPRVNYDVPTKSLTGLPWRYAIRCIDELGLILRAEIVWAKPNGLPESVTDRVRRSHEQVFHFVKQPRYYSAVDEIREPQQTIVTETGAVRYRKPGEDITSHQQVKDDKYLTAGMRGGYNGAPANPLGKLPGSVWSIPTAPLRVPEELGIDHFAAYPPELVRRIVLGWSPREVCTACGEGRRPVMSEVGWSRGKSDPVRDTASRYRSPLGAQNGNKEGKLRSLTGYACACPDTTAPSTPGVVLDPFGGTGTTALVASVHGRIGISNDLSADYCRLAQWRTTDEKQRAKAAKPWQPSGYKGGGKGGLKHSGNCANCGKAANYIRGSCVRCGAPKKPKPEPVADVVDLSAGQIDIFDLEEPA